MNKLLADVGEAILGGHSKEGRKNLELRDLIPSWEPGRQHIVSSHVSYSKKRSYPGVDIIFNSIAKSSALSLATTRGHPAGVGALRRVDGESMSRSLEEENETMEVCIRKIVCPHKISTFPSSR